MAFWATQAWSLPCLSIWENNFEVPSIRRDASAIALASAFRASGFTCCGVVPASPLLVQHEFSQWLQIGFPPNTLGSSLG
eukprot:symbB.v1.2.035453.t1/scaffold4776.1/size34967/1